ncbi:YbaB/EbfC family DNA-binding protein [Paraburkholderia sp. 2C]
MTSNAKRIGAAAILIGLALTCSRAAWSQPSAIPQPWIAYAQLAAQQFQAWLEADGDAADALHTYLEQRHKNAKGDASLKTVAVRAWFGADGTVTRVAFDSLGDAKADADLRQLLTTRPMTEPPPPDMRQPLRVQLQLEENPDADDDDSPDSPPMPGENTP